LNDSGQNLSAFLTNTLPRYQLYEGCDQFLTRAPDAGRSPVTNPPAFTASIFWGRDGGVTMSRRRKSSSQPTSEYNAYLAGWAFAFAVVLVTFMLMAHGVPF
jgi:hypothetical protein